jgi:hypothetical protein
MEFYILGDMGSGEIHQYLVSSAIEKHIKENNNENTFICGLGDNIYEKGCKSINDNQFISKFEHPYENISDKIKFYMCIGNHDYGTYCGKGNAQHQINYGRRSEKQDKKWIMPSNYYTYKKKQNDISIEFFVLDTNLDNLTKEESIKQLTEISKLIKKSKANWKIVYGHHTWRSIAGHGNAEDKLEHFLNELYHLSPFNLYMCGHDHNKQLINMKIGTDILPLIVCGTGGKVYDDPIDINFLDEKSDMKFYSNNLGYGYIKALKNKLIVTFLDENNNVEYIHEIKKKSKLNYKKMAKRRYRSKSRSRSKSHSKSHSKKVKARRGKRVKSTKKSMRRSASKSRSRSRSRSRSKSRRS